MKKSVLAFCTFPVALLTGCGGSTEPAPPGSASEETIAAVRDFDNTLSLGMRRCEYSTEPLAPYLSGEADVDADVFAVYQLAVAASRGCMQSSLEIKNIEIPPAISGSARSAAENAMAECSLASTAKHMMADILAEILDGDASPSKLQEFSDQGDFVNLSMIDCAAAISQVPVMAGVPVNEVSP